jgi:predicted DNA-binding transcriptional regulator AlpA
MKLIRWPQVHIMTSLSRNSVRKLEKLKRFPARRRINKRQVAWLESEVMTWLSNRPAVL